MTSSDRVQSRDGNIHVLCYQWCNNYRPLTDSQQESREGDQDHHLASAPIKILSLHTWCQQVLDKNISDLPCLVPQSAKSLDLQGCKNDTSYSQVTNTLAAAQGVGSGTKTAEKVKKDIMEVQKQNRILRKVDADGSSS